MEDYKQKYEQAMLRMNKWVEGSEITDPKEVAEFIFPELKESEDEKIRNEIIQSLQDNMCVIHKDKCIAWLEKQDPKKHEEELEKAYKCADEVQYRKGYEDAKREIENQNKQKLAWSEEDERLQQCLIEDQEKCLEEVKNDKVGHSEIISDLKEMYRERIDWLKSLKERYAWKPSDAQMQALEKVRVILHNPNIWDESNPILYQYEELMRDLIKLKEE